MTRTSRRKFIKEASLGVAGVAAFGLPHQAIAASTRRSVAISPHRALTISGVHAYPDQISVAAGQIISFHVSSTVPYRLSICRLGLKMDDPAGDEVLHEFPEAAAKVQPIHPGSFIHVEKGLRGKLRALTLECWVRPWKFGRRMGLIGQFDEARQQGFELYLTETGAVAARLGLHEGGERKADDLSTARNLVPNRWHHVTLTWDGQGVRLWIDAKPAASAGTGRILAVATIPLRLGAGAGEQAGHFLDADLAMPVIYDYAL